jgi:hypothetical protein
VIVLAVFPLPSSVVTVVTLLPPFHARAHRLGRPLGFPLGQYQLL